MTLEEEKDILLKLIEELTTERDELKAEVERIKTKYGEHLDSLNNEIVRLKVEGKNRMKAFVDLMVVLQDIPVNELGCLQSDSDK